MQSCPGSSVQGTKSHSGGQLKMEKRSLGKAKEAQRGENSIMKHTQAEERL